MLIVHRLSQGGHRYYFAAVGPEPADAPEIGEAPGYWIGNGADQRGLAGIVSPRDLKALLPSGPGRLPALDLTFAAPKSVSVLLGTSDPATGDRLRVAHDTAVAAALEYLEAHATAVRIDGRLVAADGLVVAAFRHRTSRADEPHLHTHAVTANVACAPGDAPGDGDGDHDHDRGDRALHTPLLYGERRAAGAVYHLTLRHTISEELGLTWSASDGGRADLECVPVEVRRAFSSRQRAVLDAAPDLTARRLAERVTRPEREGLVDMPALRERWAVRVAAAGWDPADHGHTTTRQRQAVDPAVLIPDTDRWTRADVLVRLAQQARDGLPPSAVSTICDTTLHDARVRRVGPPNGKQAAERFTTVDAIDRRSRVDAALSVAIGAHPEDLEAHRDRLRTDGHALLLIAPDDISAQALRDRTGTRTAAIHEAPAAITTLAPGDVVAFHRAARMESALVDDALITARTIGAIPVRTDPSPPLTEPRRGVAAAIETAQGGLTVATTARTAADAAIDDWLHSRRANRPAVLVADTAEVDDLNARARSALKDAHLLGDVEVGGLAAGDLVRFTSPRPSHGIQRHDQASVVKVDAAHQTVTLASQHETFDLRATQLAGVAYAHAVPPVPSLVVGDAFVVGGRALRSPGPVHHYVTVDVEDVGREAATLRATTRPPPPTVGDWRRLATRTHAADEWLATATERHHQAVRQRDPVAQAAWGAQRDAAVRERQAIAADTQTLRRRDDERAAFLERTAPQRARLAALDAHLARAPAAPTRAPDRAPDRVPDRAPDPSRDRAIGFGI